VATNKSLRISRSIFEPQPLAERIRSKWGWSETVCEYWSSGFTDTYRVQSKDYGVSYFRVYPYRWRTRGQIQGEVDLLLYLYQNGAPVSYPLCKSDGSFIESIDVPEGRRHAIMFSEAKGAPPRMDRNSSYQYGRIASIVHKLADATEKRFQRTRLDFDHLVRQPLAHIALLYGHRTKDFDYLAKLAADLSSAITSLVSNASPQFGICHGDLHFNNLHRDNDGGFTLFDFDCCGYGWRSYDVSVFLWSRGAKFDRRGKFNRTHQWNGFIDGYHSIRTLSDEEIQAAYCFVPLRHLWQLGWKIALRTRHGHRHLSELKFQQDIHFIKNWIRNFKPV